MAEGRRRLIILPREHGAWAMLCVPYVIGAGVAAWGASETLGLVGVLLLFMSRPPLALLLKRKMIDGGFGEVAGRLWINFLVFASLGTVIFLWFALHDGLWQLLLLGGVGVALFAFHGYFIFRRRERSLEAEIVGVAMLTLTAPLAIYLDTGTLLARLPAVLWLLNALFFSGSIFYVRLKLRAAVRRRQAPFREKLEFARSLIAYMASVAVVLATLVIMGLAPALCPLAFMPTLLFEAWSILTSRPGLKIRTEGFIQTALALTFASIIIVSFRP